MNIACTYSGSILLTAQSKDFKKTIGLVSVFDLDAKRQLGEFTARWDLGGTRLTLSRNEQFCLCGCYSTYGLGCYSIENGYEIWRRKDLKAIQHLVAFPQEDVVFCGREGAAHLVDAKTGNTLEKLRGMKAIYCSPFSNICLLGAQRLELHSPFGKRLTSIERSTFAVLDAAFSETEMVISESSGGVRCFDLATFKTTWTYSPPTGSHVLELEYSQELRRFLGIQWRYQDGQGGHKLLHFDSETGAIIREYVLENDFVDCEFCHQGTMLFTSAFELLSTQDGRRILEFLPEAHQIKLARQIPHA